MQEPSDSLRETPDIDPALAQAQLASFQHLLDQPMTEPRFHRWTTELGRDDVLLVSQTLGGTLWGTIRWPKSLGRPRGATLAGAFVVEHVHWDRVLDVTPDGTARFIDILAPHPRPSTWDGPHDDTHYRVSFTAPTPQRPTRIRVKFAGDVEWERSTGIQVFTPRAYRDIAPAERHFVKEDKMVVLEPFDIVLRPYFLTVQR
jgi:hypothetical protein